MDRRKFLRFLGIGTAAVAVAPTALFTEGPACVAAPIAAPECAVISGYADYASFSSLAIATALDEQMRDACKELAYRAGQSTAALYYQASS